MPLLSPDYYWTLGLARYASDADVRKAYRKLALQWHPSKYPDQRLQAEAKFREISEAFQVLSDSDRRMLYDKHGRQGLLDTEDVGISLDGVRLPAAKSPGSRRPLKGLAAFRDPNDVFFEVFGFREPPKGVALHSAEDRVLSRFLNNDHRFEDSFLGFARPATTAVLKGAPSPAIGVVTSFKGSVFSSPTDAGDYRTVAESTKVVDGRRIVTKRHVLNGRETMTVEEDGVLVSKTIDDQPCDLY